MSRPLGRNLLCVPNVYKWTANTRRKTMDWNRVEGNWKQVKGKAKQLWAKLAGDDLTYMDGHSDELVGRIQLRYGIQKESARKQPKSWEGAI